MNVIRKPLTSTSIAVVAAGFLSITVPAQAQIIERSAFPGQCSPRGTANRMLEAGEEQCQPLSAAGINAVAPTISHGNTGQRRMDIGGNSNTLGHRSGGELGTRGSGSGHGRGGDLGPGRGDPSHSSGGAPGTAMGDQDFGGVGDPGTGSGDPSTSADPNVNGDQSHDNGEGSGSEGD